MYHPTLVAKYSWIWKFGSSVYKILIPALLILDTLYNRFRLENDLGARQHRFSYRFGKGRAPLEMSSKTINLSTDEGFAAPASHPVIDCRLNKISPDRVSWPSSLVHDDTNCLVIQ